MALAVEYNDDIHNGLFDSSNYKKSKVLRNLDRDIVLSVLNDYQYSDKSVEAISKEYGLSKYMVNKIVDIAEETGSHDGRLVKRRIRDNLARELLKSNDIDWEGLNDGQIEYITNHSNYLRETYVPKTHLKGGLEIAIALDNGYSLNEVLEISGWSEGYLNRVVGKAKGKFRKGDKTLKSHLNSIISEKRIDRKKQALEFAIANSEGDVGVYQDYLEKILEPELKQDKKRKYLTGFEPSISSLNYWRGGFWKRDIKEFLGDWFSYACLGVGLAGVALGIYGSNDYAKTGMADLNSISTTKHNQISSVNNQIDSILNESIIKSRNSN